jgi:hypothetical protein
MNTIKISALWLAALAVACSTSNSGGEDQTKGACQALASGCHSASKGGGLAAECHDLGHAGDDAACFAKKSSCLAACPEVGPTDSGASDASAPSDGGAGDGATTDPACAAYCTCLAGACSAIAGYPFAPAGSCESACAAQSAAERACFPRWCAKAESSKGVHDCEHAWGKLGLDECDSL